MRTDVHQIHISCRKGKEKKTHIHVNDPNHNDVMSHKYRKLYGSVDWPDPVEILLY